ncbi:hypothetical protein P691DRAFT_808881 [Macrolepiota fuliginosa MF-IS2]|uniref:Uncharacterized protein n=1 Tax=Macrolepiota fuliginosa MF-IS2 TaxID=1400762 RepID=A0A9P5XGL6_9AGAR|nr:hypothetical protein P691DRAFT_808881 [Macrolepiota fuliginosa MF-IS2]
MLENYHKSLTGSLSACASTLVRWTTPWQRLKNLVDSPGEDFIEWEHFRDNICRKWVNLNVMCGLVMGAVSTVVFSDYPLSTAGFALGIISLLSSLIATGFGVGLIYVLGDLKGSRYHSLMKQHPKLFTFSLMIPQTWTFVSFVSFFVSCAVIMWEAENKGWLLKAGVSGCIFVITVHLAGFFYVFRPSNPELHDLTPLGPAERHPVRQRETVFGVQVGHRVQQL